jgi:hypothetical protein
MRGRPRETIEAIGGRARGRVACRAVSATVPTPPVIGNQRHSTCFLPTALLDCRSRRGRILEESKLPLIRNAAAPLRCVEQVPVG